MNKTGVWVCPSCGGMGGEVVPILDDGTGPMEPCGYCDCKGYVDKHMYFQILGYMSADAKEKRKHKQRMAQIERARGKP
jgi:hypothetical protein